MFRHFARLIPATRGAWSFKWLRGFSTQPSQPPPAAANSETTINKIWVEKERQYKFFIQSLMLPPQEQIQKIDSQQHAQHTLIKNQLHQYKDLIKIYSCKNYQSSNKSVTYPRNGWQLLEIELSKSFNLRKYMAELATNNIRTGKVLTIIDSMSVDSCYRILYEQMQQRTVSISMACIDNINQFYSIDIHKDLYFMCYPINMGKTTIELQFNILQSVQNGTDNLRVLNFSAQVLMACRNIHDLNKPQIVPKLQFEGECNAELCNKRQQVALEIKKQRAAKREETKQLLAIWEAYDKQKLNLHKQLYIQQTQLNVAAGNTQPGKGDAAAKTANIPMSQCYYDTFHLMHAKFSRVHGKVHAGQICNQAYELAQYAVYYHTGEFPFLFAINRIDFLSAISVGDFIRYESYIGYIQDNYIVVYVQGVQTTHGKPRQALANFFVIFYVRPEVKLKQIEPTNDYEKFLYQLCKKRFLEQVGKTAG